MLAALTDRAQATTAILNPTHSLTHSLTAAAGAQSPHASLLGGHFTLLSARTYRFVGRISWNMGS